MSALTSLLLLNYIAKQLPNLVGKGLPFGVIAEFILLSLPFTIAMTLPMAVLVATLHAFSRLAADSEITAFKASGMALPRIMLPVVLSGLALSAVMVFFNDRVMPAANYQLQSLMNDIARKKPTFALRPQVINEVSPGRLFLRAGHLEGGSSEMRDVTIYDFSDGQRRRTIRADSGHVELSPDGRDLLLSLSHGYVNEINRTEMNRLQRVFFETNFVRVRGIGNDLERSTMAGEKSDRERTVCELESQLQASVAQRDSIYAAIGRISPPTARAIDARPVRASSGSVYCGFLRMLSPRTAQAATRQPAGALIADDAFAQGTDPAVQAGRTDSSAQAARADSLARAARTDSAARAAIAAYDSSTAAATAQQALAGAVTNDSIDQRAGGISLPSRPEEDPTNTPVLLEGMKLQLANAQRVINGNQVEIEKKFAIATACVIFALLGAPIAFRFPRGGVGMTIGVSLAVFGVYYVGLIAGEELARRGLLPAFIAMWATNAALLLIGVVLTARLGTEGTTHRGSELSESLGRLRGRLRRRFGSAPAAT